MRLRTKLLLLLAFLIGALFVNLFALLLLVRTFSQSLQTIQDVTVRQQATALQMQAVLSDAEAALYRYQIEGEAGFAVQFEDRLNEFGLEIGVFNSLAASEQERTWVSELKQAHKNAHVLGLELIEQRDNRTADLQTMEMLQAEIMNLLDDFIATSQNDNPDYQDSVNNLLASLNLMPSAVTAYLTTSDEIERIIFTETAVAFRQHLNQFRTHPGTVLWANELAKSLPN